MIQRKFLFGDQWLYYKIYCGKKTSDTILTDLIQPLCNKLLNQNLIKKWFFIRYQDPQNHLRVRFLLSDNDFSGELIKSFNEQIREYFENGLIWNVETEVYNRELERYGNTTITEAEDFFYKDSSVCLKVLSKVKNDETIFLFLLKYIDIILTCFGYSLDQKLEFAREHLDSFKLEFKADKKLNKQLNIKYQNLRQYILPFMQSENEYVSSWINTNEMQKFAELITKKLNTENIILDDLLSSYLHMSINRLFRDKQRLHELVCYSCLHKYYQFKVNTTI